MGARAARTAAACQAASPSSAWVPGPPPHNHGTAGTQSAGPNGCHLHRIMAPPAPRQLHPMAPNGGHLHRICTSTQAAAPSGCHLHRIMGGGTGTQAAAAQAARAPNSVLCLRPSVANPQASPSATRPHCPKPMPPAHEHYCSCLPGVSQPHSAATAAPCSHALVATPPPTACLLVDAVYKVLGPRQCKRFGNGAAVCP